jgi:acetyl-CoA synthetase
VGERFNWAHDWFDVFARGNDAVGLVVVEEDGYAASYSFTELVDASDRRAPWLRGKGVHKGDAILVMLGNQVELWQNASWPDRVRRRLRDGTRRPHRARSWAWN